MKKVLLPFAVALLAAVSFMLTSCPGDIKTSAELGREASKAACDCIEDGKTASKCEDELNKNYKGDIDDEFIEAFNDSNTCDITISEI